MFLVLFLVLPVSPAAAHNEAAVSLKQDMRRLWTDHVVWTRSYIVAAVADQPDVKAAEKRLLQNQEDIGNAVGKIYGAPAGQQLTALLKEHITIAADLIKAARSFDKVYGHILTMSDALSDGIVRQFPEKFGGGSPQ